MSGQPEPRESCSQESYLRLEGLSFDRLILHRFDVPCCAAVQTRRMFGSTARRLGISLLCVVCISSMTARAAVADTDSTNAAEPSSSVTAPNPSGSISSIPTTTEPSTGAANSDSTDKSTSVKSAVEQPSSAPSLTSEVPGTTKPDQVQQVPTIGIGPAPTESQSTEVRRSDPADEGAQSDDHRLAAGAAVPQVAVAADVDLSEQVGLRDSTHVNSGSQQLVFVFSIPGADPTVTVVDPGGSYVSPTCPPSAKVCTYDTGVVGDNGQPLGNPVHRVFVNGADTTPGNANTRVSYDSSSSLPVGYSRSPDGIHYKNSTGSPVLIQGFANGSPFKETVQPDAEALIPLCGSQGCTLQTFSTPASTNGTAQQLSVFSYSNGQIMSSGTENGGGSFVNSGKDVRFTNNSATPQSVRYLRNDGDEAIAIVTPGQTIILPPCLGAIAQCEYASSSDRLVVTNTVATTPPTTSQTVSPTGTSAPATTTAPAPTTQTTRVPDSSSRPTTTKKKTPQPTKSQQSYQSNPKNGYDFLHAVQAVGLELAELKKIDPKSWAAAMHVSPDVAKLIVKVVGVVLSAWDVAEGAVALGTGHGRVSDALTYASGIFGTVAGLLPFFIPQAAVARLAMAGLSLALTAMAIGIKGSKFDACLGQYC